MKKIAASIGLVALGTTAIYAVESSALNSMQSTKPWSVAASLRGFYDDNINTLPDKTESLGYQIEPSFDFGMAGEQTSVNFGYTLTANYYETKPINESDKWDLTHAIEAALSHTFNPRLDMIVTDSFAIGQEPDVLRAGSGAFATVQRINGNNMRNYATIDFNAELTQLLGLGFGYNNAVFKYDDVFYSGPLDRMQHGIRLDSNWKIRPQTVAILGYTYGQTLYTGDEQIMTVNPGAIPIYSDDRNARSHIFYAGAQHSFSPNLSGLLKVGGQYIDYYNDPINSDTTLSPYVEANMRYQYQTRTSFDLGCSYQHNAANESGLSGSSDYVRDIEAFVLYGSVSHELLPHLTGTASATGQYATYNGGGPGYDGESYLFLQLGLRLAYQFTPNLSTHVSYNYDDLDSDIAGSSYNRNRIYLGVTAAY